MEATNDSTYTLIDPRMVAAKEQKPEPGRAKPVSKRNMMANKSVGIARRCDDFSLLDSLGSMNLGNQADSGPLPKISGDAWTDRKAITMTPQQKTRLTPTSLEPKEVNQTKFTLKKEVSPAKAGLKVSTLANPFKKTTAIVIDTFGMTKEECLEVARNTWTLTLKHFDALSPCVTYAPRPNKTKCKGSYSTPDKLHTTNFEAQVWEVDQKNLEESRTAFHCRVPANKSRRPSRVQRSCPSYCWRVKDRWSSNILRQWNQDFHQRRNLDACRG